MWVEDLEKVQFRSGPSDSGKIQLSCNYVLDDAQKKVSL
jgi:hypothetical protein